MIFDRVRAATSSLRDWRTGRTTPDLATDRAAEATGEAYGPPYEEEPFITELLHAEDLSVGTHYDLGSWEMSPEELRTFAVAWDPLPIHVDQAAADAGHYGGLIASGIHTLAVVQRLAVDGAYSRWSIYAGRALRDVRFLRPVRAGMRLEVSLAVIGLELSHADRGLVTLHAEARHEGNPVLQMVVETWVLRASRD